MADPGFPRSGGANSKGGYERLSFSQFLLQKLHKIERIWIQREVARPWRLPPPPLDPPMSLWNIVTYNKPC